MVTDIIGMTGRAMLAALIAGETDPSKLAVLAHPRIKAPPAQLREALRGRIMKHHRFLLRLHLQQIDAIDAAVAEIDREVGERIEPFRTTVELLTTIPGIGELGARIIAAEIGNDMSRFATAAHLISWAGLCPKNDESAARLQNLGYAVQDHGAPWRHNRPNSTRGTPHLVGGCRAPPRKKGSYIQAQFHRIRSRRGAQLHWIKVVLSQGAPLRMRVERRLPLGLRGFGTTIEVVRAQVLIAGTVLEHVVDGGEDRSSDGADGLFGAVLSLPNFRLPLSWTLSLSAGRAPNDTCCRRLLFGEMDGARAVEHRGRRRATPAAARNSPAINRRPGS